MKEYIGLIGGIAGLLSALSVLYDRFIKWKRRPRLAYRFDITSDVKTWGIGKPFLSQPKQRRMACIRIYNINNRNNADECEAVLSIGTQEYPLHWADTLYEAHSSSMARVSIGLNERRLDILFSERDQSGPGCMIASSQALASGFFRNQFYLHDTAAIIGRIIVSCTNGDGVIIPVKIISGNTWEEMSLSIAE